MTTITISAGGKAGAYRGEPGVYTATLVSHSIEGPFPAKQPKFEGETFRLHEWGFAIDDTPDEESMVWITSGESTGPKSKTFGIISALFGGKEPPIGTELDIEKQLIGRQALVDVRPNERGYLDCVSVTPMPRAMKAAAPKAAPVPVAEGDDDVPF